MTPPGAATGGAFIGPASFIPALRKAVPRRLRDRRPTRGFSLDLGSVGLIRIQSAQYPPTCALVLRRCRQLAADGLLECVGGPNGYYGYEWSITPAGRLSLKEQNNG